MKLYHLFEKHWSSPNPSMLLVGKLLQEGAPWQVPQLCNGKAWMEMAKDDRKGGVLSPPESEN